MERPVGRMEEYPRRVAAVHILMAEVTAARTRLRMVDFPAGMAVAGAGTVEINSVIDKLRVDDARD